MLPFLEQLLILSTPHFSWEKSKSPTKPPPSQRKGEGFPTVKKLIFITDTKTHIQILVVDKTLFDVSTDVFFGGKLTSISLVATCFFLLFVTAYNSFIGEILLWKGDVLKVFGGHAGLPVSQTYRKDPV